MYLKVILLFVTILPFSGYSESFYVVPTNLLELSEVDLKSRTERHIAVFGDYYIYEPDQIMFPDSCWDSWFWLWLLNHQDEQAGWVYHYRDIISQARFQYLVAVNGDLRDDLIKLENMQLAKNSRYTPKAIDLDLMYAMKCIKTVDIIKVRKQEAPVRNFLLFFTAGLGLIFVRQGFHGRR